MSPALFQGFSDLKTNKKWYLVDIQMFLKYKMLANSRHLENTEVGESLFIFIIPTWVEIHIRGEGERKYEIAVSPLQNHTGHWTFFSFLNIKQRTFCGIKILSCRDPSFRTFNIVVACSSGILNNFHGKNNTLLMMCKFSLLHLSQCVENVNLAKWQLKKIYAQTTNVSLVF